MFNWKTRYQIQDQTFFTDDTEKTTNAIRIQDNTKVCLKKINRFNQYGQTESYYLSILKQIFTQRHDNIVNVLDIYEDNTKYAYIVMENCSNNLLHYFNNNSQGFNNQQIILFMKQIIKGYQQLIEQGVLHRDLKPENIYYIQNNNNILFKIGGFEHSKILDDRDQPIDENTKLENWGYYQAPEQSMHNYSFNADIYSFGLILFEMATKQKLKNLKSLEHKNLQDLCNLDNIDHTIKDLLCKMIVFNHQKRITWSLLIKNLFYETIEKIGPNEKVKSKENGQTFFIKIIQKPKKNDEYYLGLNGKQELSINRLFKGKNHPNIVKIYEILHEPESTQIHIIMEDCDGNLENLLKNKQFDALEILDLASQINEGYKVLENANIIHRDIKPENILYKKVDDKIQYKITDFGVSRITDEACTKCGTYLYAAPEVKGTCTYTNKCDIFSLGIVFYYLATQKFPFQEIKIKQLIETLKEKTIIEYCYPSDLVLDEVIKSLINKMIVLEPNKRINWGKEMDDLIQSLKNQLSPKKQISFNIKNVNQQQFLQMQNNNSIQSNNIKVFANTLPNSQPKPFANTLPYPLPNPLPNNLPNPLPNNFQLDKNQQFQPKNFSINNQVIQNQPQQTIQSIPKNNLNKFQITNQYYFTPKNQSNQLNQNKIFNQNKTISFLPQQNNQQNQKTYTQPD